jgi:hypothetical protein
VVAATLIGAGIAAAFASTSLREPHTATAGGLPATLRETGFFTQSRLPFTPQYPLWSDGATKRRWIHLPAGTSIDATDVDAWEFPVGTQLWKEFSFRGARVETRYMTRTPGGWQLATYIWNAAGTDATLAPTSGADSVELAPGVRHRIPGAADCRACHGGSPVPVLAFSALQLSPDRDPNAPHRETPVTGSLDLPGLVARGLVRGLPAAMMFVPPRIPGTPVERASLGYLHANCGGCHRADGLLASVGLELAASVESPGAAKRTTIDRAAHFMAPRMRIAPGDPAQSVVLARMSSRNPVEQMPPLGTQLVDTEATRLLTAWIEQLEKDH